MSKFLETLKAAKQAYEFRKKRATDPFVHGDEPEPDDFITRARIIISLLNKDELTRQILYASSANYGGWVFDQVFPRADNPVEFNSTPSMISLSDRPVQVLGWKETDDLLQQGNRVHDLDEQWTQIGFHMRAQERRIDLEWHFHEFPPGQRKLSR